MRALKRQSRSVVPEILIIAESPSNEHHPGRSFSGEWASREQSCNIVTSRKQSFVPAAVIRTGTFLSAQVLRAGKRLTFVEAEVTTDGAKHNAMVAKASSTLAFIPLALKNKDPRHDSTGGA